MKCISYSLFGYNQQHPSCFSFDSYLRGFMLNLRMNRLIYPDWNIVLHLDEGTYRGHVGLFDSLTKAGICEVVICEPSPLCKAMLWRMKPVFEMHEGQWKYSHVLCRDLDSPSTYREAQAVKYWMNKDKAMHAITDSVSHTIPLMGGMIGMIPAYFN